MNYIPKQKQLWFWVESWKHGRQLSCLQENRKILWFVCTTFFSLIYDKNKNSRHEIKSLIEQKAVMWSQGKKQMDLDTSCLNGTERQIQVWGEQLWISDWWNTLFSTAGMVLICFGLLKLHILDGLMVISMRFLGNWFNCHVYENLFS